MSSSNIRAERRKERTRFAVKSSAHGRPRLSVFRSGRHIYAQIIADDDGRTVAAALTVDSDLKGKVKAGASKAAAAEVGKLLAQRAVQAGIKEVVFDRGAYLFHGRVKALADAAREAGLSF